MSRSQLLLLLLYAVINPVLSLPITSTPLEDNPYHLSDWDAQLSVADYRNEYEEVRKIPKSIFITPHLNESACRPGYRLDSDGKCRRIADFTVDPNDILKTQLASLFMGHNAGGPSSAAAAAAAAAQQPSYEDDYDYDYDSSPDSSNKGPFHVPLSIGFGDAPKPNEPQPFRDGDGSSHHHHHQHHQDDEDHYIYKDATRPDVVVVISSTTTNAAKRSTEPFTASTEPVLSSSSSSSSGDVSTSTVTSTAATATTLPSMVTTTESTTDNIPPTTTSFDEPSTTDSTTITATDMVPLTNKQLEFDLQSESLFQDEEKPEPSEIGVSSEPNDDDVEGSTTIVGSGDGYEPTATTEKPIRKFTSASPPSKTEETVIVLAETPTTDHRNVQIVTASSEAVTTDDEMDDGPTADSSELLNLDQSEQAVRLHDQVVKHELNEDEIVTTDQHNRFVYNHLEHPPTETTTTATTSTTTTSTSTEEPPPSSKPFLDLKLIQQFTDENRKIQQRLRFPTDDHLFSATNRGSNGGGLIRFPERRLFTTLAAKEDDDDATRADAHPPSSSSGLFSWLPSGWSFIDRGGPTTTAAAASSPIRFWKHSNREQPSSSIFDSTDRARENSKSPSESMYRDLPTASDIYKVLVAKNSKHNNN